MSEDKSILLKPAARAWFWSLFWGIILTPLFGIGLVLLWFFYRKRSSLHYEVHDRFIRVHENSTSRRMDLADIEHVTVSQRWIDRQLNVGTVELSSASDSVHLVGMGDPHPLSDMIIHAARAERKRRELAEKTAPVLPKHSPGTLDKIDYLTGIWQQGLISNEEYEKERKHFENGPE